MKKIKLLAVAAVFVAVFSVFALAEGLIVSPNPMAQSTASDNKAQTQIVFKDISETASYKDAVYKLVSNGVLNGYPDGTFRPEHSITRAEMCKMINLTFGYVDTEGAAGFPDLVPGEWYIPYVLAAQKAGYVQGDAIGTFRPNDNISREEVCAILYRIIKPYDLEIPVVIKDAVSDWARPYVEAMVKNALIPLDADGSFRATLPIKRHELATVVAPHSNIKVDEIKCTVTFKNGDTVHQTSLVSIGKSLQALPVIESVPEGYKFGGWSKLANEALLVDTTTIFFENTTLYAYFEKLEYKVKFIINSYIQVSEAMVKYKEFAVKPIDPVLTEHRFDGWSIDGKTVVDVATYEITKDTTFIAVFTEIGIGGTGGGAGGGAGGGTGGGTGGGGNSGDNGSDDNGSDNGENGGNGSEDNGSDNGENGGNGSENNGSDNGENGGNGSEDNGSDDGENGGNGSEDNGTDDGENGGNGSEDNGSDDGENGGNGSEDNGSDDGENGGNGSEDNGSDDGGNGGNGSEDNGSDDGGNGGGEIIIYYTVTFVVDEKTYSTQVVVRGEAPDEPADPGLSGYVFLYWSSEENGDPVKLEDEEILADKTFYAVFSLVDENPNDEETIESLKLAAKIFRYKVSAATDYQVEVKKIVLDTIDLVLIDAENGEYVDSDYVRGHYEKELKAVNKILDEDMTKNEKSEFITRVMNAFKSDKEKAAFNTLADFFLSESTKQEYLPGYGK